MKVRLSQVLAVMGFMAVAVYAQTDVPGKWTGELAAAPGKGPAQPVTLELKLDGEALTGSVTEGALGVRPITNAAVEGSAFSFRTTQNFGGQDIVVNWFGEVKSDVLTLMRSTGPTAEAGGGGGGRGGGGGAAGAAGGARGGGGRGGAAPAPTDAAAPPAAGAPQAGAGRGGGGRGGAAPAPTDGAAPAAGAPPAAGGRGGAPAAGAAAGGRGAAAGGQAPAAAAGGRGGGGGGGRGGGAAPGAAAARPTVTRLTAGTTLTLKRVL